MGNLNRFPLVVIGGGPGGLAAALTAASLGIRTLMVDEADAPGGQVYQAFPAEFDVKVRLSGRKMLREREAIVKAVSADTRIIKWQDGLFWGVDEKDTLLIAREKEIERVGYDSLIVASGAYDRSLPFPGWTLPGVLSVGGAYRLVKTQFVLPGRRVLIAGTGPLLLVLARALLQAGAKVIAVVDSSKAFVTPNRMRSLMKMPSLCIEALYLKATLRRHKTPEYKGWGVIKAQEKASGIQVICAPFTKQGRPDLSGAKTFETDAAAVGYGLLSRTAVIRLLGAEMVYDSLVRDFIPRRSEYLETSIDGVFAVGDGARVSGKLVAKEEGVLAGLAAAHRLGKISDSAFLQRSEKVRRKLKRLYDFRNAIDEIYRLPEGLFDIPEDDTILCRCEEVTAGEIRQAALEGTFNLNDIKRRVRAGSGWCQGRTCGRAIVEMLARTHHVPQEKILRMTQRPPTKPIPLSMLIRHGLKTTKTNKASGDE